MLYIRTWQHLDVEKLCPACKLGRNTRDLSDVEYLAHTFKPGLGVPCIAVHVRQQATRATEVSIEQTQEGFFLAKVDREIGGDRQHREKHREHQHIGGDNHEAVNLLVVDRCNRYEH